MQKAIIYVRVSSREQAEEGYSIEAQQKFLHQYAAEKGIEIVKEFVEIESAKAAGRPAFNEMLAYLHRQKQVKTILCEKTDRLYRNFTDYVALDIDQQDLTLILAKEGETLNRQSKSHQKLVHGLKVLLAKNYIDNLKEEIIKGMSEKVRQGGYPQKAPTGYINNTETRTLAIDQKRAPLVKKIFELYASGSYSLEQVHEIVEKKGLLSRSGKNLSKSNIHWILNNPIYYGYFRWKGELYKGTHEPIISKSLFDAVQEQFASLNRPRKTKRDFAYTGMMRCSKCGCMITAELKKGKYVYYHCTNFKGKCDNAYVREEDVEAQFDEAVRQIVIPADKMKWLKTALQESHRDEKTFHEETVKALNRELAQIQDWTDKAYRDKLTGVISEDYWRKKAAEWTGREQTIAETLRKHQSANRCYFEEGVRILELANKAYDLFKVRKSHEKRELLNYILSNCVLNGKKIEFTYRKPFDIFAEGSSCSNGRSTSKKNWRAMLEAVDGNMLGHRLENCEIVSSAGLFRYGGLASIGMVLVRPQYQKQGLAGELMRQCIAMVPAEVPLVLVATEQGKPVYEHFGFITVGTESRLTAEGNTLKPDCRADEYTVTAFTETHREAVYALDSKANGANRRVMLDVCINLADRVLLLEADGEVKGFGLTVDYGTSHIIGPIIAPTARAAARLAAELIPPASPRVQLDVPSAQTEFTRTLQNWGFQIESTAPVMVRNAAGLPGDRSLVYALASRAYG